MSIKRKWCLLLYIFTGTLFAQCIEKSEECANVGEWDISIALGYGELTNPLHGGENISLVVIPSISYYGENVFFEKVTLGYTFYQHDMVAVSAVTQPNRENAFFSRWHVNNIFVNNFINSVSGETLDSALEEDSKNTSVSIDVSDVKKRKWALDAGLQLNWFINKNTQFQSKILHDINSVYNGWNGQLSIHRHFTVNNKFSVNASIGAYWLSAEQSHYYYGIDWQDNLPSSVFYQGKSSVNTYVKLKARYNLTNDWFLTASLYREFIDENISKSPLMKEGYIDTYYLGAVYAF